MICAPRLCLSHVKADLANSSISTTDADIVLHSSSEHQGRYKPGAKEQNSLPWVWFIQLIQPDQGLGLDVDGIMIEPTPPFYACTSIEAKPRAVCLLGDYSVYFAVLFTYCLLVCRGCLPQGRIGMASAFLALVSCAWHMRTCLGE